MTEDSKIMIRTAPRPAGSPFGGFANVLMMSATLAARPREPQDTISSGVMS